MTTGHPAWAHVPELSLDRRSPVPVYHQLAEKFESAIRDGLLQPGDLLEGEIALARRLELSRPTVRHAIDQLATKGLVVRRRGVGTAVAPGASRGPGAPANLLDDEVGQQSGSTTTVLRLVHGERDPRAADRLGLAPDARLVAIESIRHAGGTPIALLRTWLPLELPDLAPAQLEVGGLHEYLGRRGITVATVSQSIGSRASTALERTLLGLGRGDPILTISRVAYGHDGAPIEYGDHCYRADRYQFHVTLQSTSAA